MTSKDNTNSSEESVSPSVGGETEFNVRKLMLLFLVVATLLAVVDIGWGLIDAASIDAPPRLHNPIVSPVEVDVDYGAERTVPPLAVSRISPRGISSTIRGRTDYFARAAIFSDIEFAAEQKIWENVQSVEVEMGRRSYSLTGKQLRANSSEQADDSGLFVVSLRRAEASASAPGSLSPSFDNVLNYRGDGTVLFWLILRTAIGTAALVGAWHLYSIGFFRNKRNTAHLFAAGWAVVGVLAFLLSKSWIQERPLVVSDLASSVYLGVLVCVVLLAATLVLTGGSVKGDHIGSERSVDKGWGPSPVTRFWLPIVALFVLAAGLRAWNLDYMQGNDTFNLTAALALNETGTFAYPRNIHLTHGIAAVLRTLGHSLEAVRLPFVAISLLAMVGIARLAAPLGKRSFWLALILYALAPVAIEHASTIREYGENLFVATVLLGALVSIYLRYRAQPIRAFWFLTLFLIVSTAAVDWYSAAVSNMTIPAVVQISAFTYVSLLIVLAWREWPSHRRWTALASALGFVLVIALTPKIGPFGSEFSLPYNFFRVYFDPFHFRQMQWFSFQAITPVVLVLIVLAATSGGPHRDLRVAFSLALWSSLLLFSLRSDDTTQGRYVYHLLPLYVVLFAGGLERLWSNLRAAVTAPKSRREVQLLFLIGCAFVIWPPNTLIAARHEVPREQVRRVSSLTPEDETYALHEILTNRGLTLAHAVVVHADQPDNFSWLLNRPVTQTYQMSRNAGRTFALYDAAEGLFYQNPDKLAYGLDSAVSSYETGFYLHQDRPGRIPEIVANGIELEFVTSAHGFSIYRW